MKARCKKNDFLNLCVKGKVYEFDMVGKDYRVYAAGMRVGFAPKAFNEHFEKTER